MSKYVIVGGGVAGFTAARNLVKEVSSQDEVHVLTDEPHPYYPRPLLWRFIAGTMDREALYSQPLSWYEDRGIHLHLSTEVAALDVRGHRLTLADGSDMHYDRLLLATGAHPFVPPCEGTEKEGVFTLRTFQDAQRIKAYAEDVLQTLVVGGGLLGLETARALQEAGPRAHVIEIADHLLPRQLDPEGAQVLRALLERQGLAITTDAVVEAILGDERAERVRTKDGRVIEGQLVLFSAGIRCRAHLAEDAGLDVNRGAIVDEQMRTSAEDVFAAGDVAEFEGDIGGTIPPAMKQAEVTAANMISPGSKAYSGTLPMTTLEVVGARVTSLGEFNPSEEDEGYSSVRYADEDEGIYRKFVLRNNRLVGAILINDPQRAALARRMIDDGTIVSKNPEQLVQRSSI